MHSNVCFWESPFIQLHSVGSSSRDLGCQKGPILGPLSIRSIRSDKNIFRALPAGNLKAHRDSSKFFYPTGFNARIPSHHYRAVQTNRIGTAAVKRVTEMDPSLAEIRLGCSRRLYEILTDSEGHVDLASVEVREYVANFISVCFNPNHLLFFGGNLPENIALRIKTFSWACRFKNLFLSWLLV